MAAPYAAVVRASSLPRLCRRDAPADAPKKAARKRVELREAADFHEAIAAADQIALERGYAPRGRAGTLALQRDVLAGLSDYLGRGEDGGQRDGEQPQSRKSRPRIERIRAIDLEIKGTWGAYDLEWLREMWLHALRRGLDGDGKPAEEMF